VSLQKPTIKLRGHHLICLHFFRGEGYNPEFIANLNGILNRAEAGEEIEVYSGADDVCKMCPYLKEGICFYDKDTEAEIREMDRRAIRLLRLRTRWRVKWLDIREKIPQIFCEWAREYCKDCNWRTVCEKENKYRRMVKGFSGEKTKSKF